MMGWIIARIVSLIKITLTIAVIAILALSGDGKQ